MTTESTESPQDPAGGDAPARTEATGHPGGCGIMTCLTLSMVLGAVLLAFAIYLAMFRPGLTHSGPAMP